VATSREGGSAAGELSAFARLVPSPMARGMLLAVAAGIAFQCLNATIKLLVADLPPLFVAWSCWTIGLLFMINANRLADISAVQPTFFLGIVWAALFGHFMFGRSADPPTFIGAAVIVASTSYIAHREAAAARRGSR
jgi:drug/metabolite transporter (DMT)-like permease